MPFDERQRIEPSWSAPMPLPQEPLNRFAPPRSMAGLKLRSSDLLPHRRAGRVIRLMAWLGVLATVGLGAAVLLPAQASGEAPPLEALSILAVVAVLTIALFFVAGAVLRHATWGRVAGIAYGVVALFGFPIGTIVGLYVLWQLVFGWGATDAPN